MQDLTYKAINAAIKQDWQTAINLNQQILEAAPNHIPTLNRLAKAYKENGHTDKALDNYSKVLELDQYNSIAKRNISRLKKSNGHQTKCQDNLIAKFIDDPGRTKTLKLVKLGNADVLETLQCGQPVKLVVKKRGIVVTTTDDSYIGSLTDDIAFKLKKYLEANCHFQCAICSNHNNQVQVFVRETHRSQDLKHLPPFAE